MADGVHDDVVADQLKRALGAEPVPAPDPGGREAMYAGLAAAATADPVARAGRVALRILQDGTLPRAERIGRAAAAVMRALPPDRSRGRYLDVKGRAETGDGPDVVTAVVVGLRAPGYVAVIVDDGEYRVYRVVGYAPLPADYEARLGQGPGGNDFVLVHRDDMAVPVTPTA